MAVEILERPLRPVEGRVPQSAAAPPVRLVEGVKLTAIDDRSRGPADFAIRSPVAAGRPVPVEIVEMPLAVEPSVTQPVTVVDVTLPQVEDVELTGVLRGGLLLAHTVLGAA